MSASNALSTISSIPRNDDGPIFAEPWQAQAFAMAVSLNEQGFFTWSEWAQMIAVEIARDGSPQAYYENWLTCLEKLLAIKGLIGEHERLERTDAWGRASRATPHGEPIVLGRDEN